MKLPKPIITGKNIPYNIVPSLIADKVFHFSSLVLMKFSSDTFQLIRF